MTKKVNYKIGPLHSSVKFGSTFRFLCCVPGQKKKKIVFIMCSDLFPVTVIQLHKLILHVQT